MRACAAIGRSIRRKIVVNGATHVLGSDRAAIERAIVQTDRNAAIMSVPVLMSVGGSKLNVKIEPSGRDRFGGEVWLCPLAKAVPVANRPRRKSRAHDHLSQCRAALAQARRLDRR